MSPDDLFSSIAQRLEPRLAGDAGSIPAGGAKSSTAFERFWAAYPRKEDKTIAAKAFARALAKANSIAIVSAAVIYAEHNRGKEKKFIKLAATWLNGECWNNEVIQKPVYGPLRVLPPDPEPDPAMQQRVGALMAVLAAELRLRSHADAEIARRKAQERDARRRECLVALGIQIAPRGNVGQLRASPELERIVRARMVRPC